MDRDPVGELRGEWPQRRRARNELIELQPEVSVMTRLQPKVSGPGSNQREEVGRWLAARRRRLRLHEVGAAAQVDEIRFEPRWPPQKVRHLVELVENVARLATAVGALEGLVVPVEHVVVGRLVEDEL